MTAALLVWALALAIPVVLLLLMRHKARRVTREPDPGESVHATRQRSERHEALLAALSDWLEAEKIVAALVKSGLKARNLYDLRNQLGELNEAQILATAAVVLKERGVRQVIATWTEQRYGLAKGTGIRCLREIADLKESA